MAGAVAVAGTAAFCGITAASVTTVGASAAFRIAVIPAAGSHIITGSAASGGTVIVSASSTASASGTGSPLGTTVIKIGAAAVFTAGMITGI